MSGKIMRKEHHCTLCGSEYDNISFKGGYICEQCIHVLKRLYKND